MTTKTTENSVTRANGAQIERKNHTAIPTQSTELRCYQIEEELGREPLPKGPFETMVEMPRTCWSEQRRLRLDSYPANY